MSGSNVAQEIEIWIPLKQPEYSTQDVQWFCEGHKEGVSQEGELPVLFLDSHLPWLLPRLSAPSLRLNTIMR